MTTHNLYLMNTWYVAALSSEIEDQALFHRKILDTSVLIYRLENGGVVARQDRCPHRFVPLSMGRREGDDVVCAYHGLNSTVPVSAHSIHMAMGTSPKQHKSNPTRWSNVMV